MKVRSRRLSRFGARALLVICAAVFAGSVHAVHAEAGEGESPGQRERWAFQQRAYPLGYIPEGAQMRALRQIHAARAARASTNGGAAADSDRWVNIGPAPIVDKRPMSGRVAAIAVDPHNPQHWLIGAAHGGVWETLDGGTTWIPKTDDAASLAMGAIAFALSDPNIIYAGTGEAKNGGDAYGGAGLLKSVDAGATWELLAAATFSGASFSALEVDPNDAGIVVATTRDRGFGRESYIELPRAPQTGIFKSSDGGATWSNRLIGRASALAVDRGNFNHQFGAIGSQECGDGPLPCVGPAPLNAVRNGLYRSTDAGDSWTLIAGPWDAQPGGVGRVELALAPSNSNVLYVSIQDAFDHEAIGYDGALLGLWKTTNAWDPAPSWTQIDVSQTDNGTGLYGYCGWGVDPQDVRGVKTQCFYDHALLVDQSDPDILYAAGVPLWKFDGTNWTEISRTADVQHGIHVDQQSLAWAGNRLIVGNDGGLWSTADDGGTWTDHNTSLAITQFYKGAVHPTNPSFAIGGSQDNGFEQWTGVDAWQYVFLGDIDGLDTAISASQPDTQWALAGQSLAIFRTVTAPSGRVAAIPAGTGIDLGNADFGSRFEKCPANEDVFIAGTNKLWRTTDFFSASPLVPGPTWSANSPEMGECGGVFSGSAGCITAMGFAAADATCNTYAYATGDGRLRRTTNGGNSWDDIDPTNTVPDRFVTDLAFAPGDANTLYVTLSGFDEGTPAQPGHVFKTTNALAAAPAWLDVSPPVDQPQNAIAVDPGDPLVVYAGADMGVWKSTDGASTWTQMGPETGMPNVAVFDLEIQPTTRRPFAFTYGRGAFVLACRSDAECDDQNAGNGVETCDLTSGRCQAGVAPPTASATPTPSPTPAPTATATVTTTFQGCVGDCSGTHTVAVNNIIILVNIALGNAQASACAHGVPSGGEVNVAMIIQAVNNALNGYGELMKRVERTTPTKTRKRLRMDTALHDQFEVWKLRLSSGVPKRASARRAMIVGGSRHVERGFDRLVQLADLVGVACAHQALQAMARYGEDVVEVRHTPDWQPLPTAEHDLGRELTDRSGDQRDDDRTDAVENSIPRQDHDGAVTDWWRQFSPPHLAALHALRAFQSGMRGSSPKSAACASATWLASRSVIAADSRYCRTASSTSARTSRPCFAARFRSCSSTPPGSSIPTARVYTRPAAASTDAGCAFGPNLFGLRVFKPRAHSPTTSARSPRTRRGSLPSNQTHGTTRRRAPVCTYE